MDLNAFDERLKSLEDRLNKIEWYLQINTASSTFSSSYAASLQTKKPTSITTNEKIVEKNKSGNWLGYIAVICFVVAAAFIIKLSIDSGWLTPIRQIGLAYVFGISLVLSGFVFFNSDREYASLLPSAGIIILYLTTFASHQYYAVFSFLTALSIACVISCICIWLYLKFKQDLYAFTAVIGTYTAPIFLGFYYNPIFCLYFFSICSLTFTVLSVWLRSRALIQVSTYLALWVIAEIGFELNINYLAALTLFGQFLIFTLGNLIYSIKNNVVLTKKEAWLFFPALILFYIVEYCFLKNITPIYTPWIALAFTLGMFIIYLVTLLRFPKQLLASHAMLLTYIILIGYHSIYFGLLTDTLKPWIFVAILLGFILTPSRFHTKKNPQSLFYFPLILISLILTIEYMRIVISLFEYDYQPWLKVACASFISIWLLIIVHDELFKKEIEVKYIVLSAAHLLGMICLYRLTQPISSLAVSISWLVYAICVILYAYQRHNKIMANSALIVLSVAAAKALIYDASSAPTLIRILCLLVTGAVLYGAGFLFRKISTWK